MSGPNVFRRESPFGECDDAPLEGASKNGSLGALGRFGRRVVDSSTFESGDFIRLVRVETGDGGLVSFL